MEITIRIPYAASRIHRGRSSCGTGTSGDAIAVRVSILPQLTRPLANHERAAKQNVNCEGCHADSRRALGAIGATAGGWRGATRVAGAGPTTAGQAQAADSRTKPFPHSTPG